MARSIARQPWRLGIILSILPVLAIGLFFVRSLISEPDGSDVQSSGGGEITASPGSPDIESAAGNPAGHVPPANDDSTASGGGNDWTETAGDESGYLSLLISDLAATAGQDNQPGPPPNNPVPPVPGGVLSGYVWQEDIMDGPLDKITVFLADTNGTFNGMSAKTGKDGGFNFANVPAGSYKLYVFDDAGLYKSGWYGDAEVPQGKAVGISTGSRSFITYKLHAAGKSDFGSISGRVTSPSGDGIRKTEISAYLIKSDGGMELIRQVSTDDGGYYDLADLPATAAANGQENTNLGYKIKFSPPAESGYAPQWYKNQPTLNGAKLISFDAGEAVDGIDAQLAGGGTISGSVTLDGQPAAFAAVEIFDASGIVANFLTADANGNFQSGILTPAGYKIHARDAGMKADEWYQDKKDYPSADTVSVTAGQDAGGITITLESAQPALPNRAPAPNNQAPDLAAASQYGEEPVTISGPAADGQEEGGAGSGSGPGGSTTAGGSEYTAGETAGSTEPPGEGAAGAASESASPPADNGSSSAGSAGSCDTPSPGAECSAGAGSVAPDSPAASG